MRGFAGLGTIFRTTLVDQTRDRRSVGAAFIYALLGPVVMLLAFSAMARTQDEGEALKLAVYGSEAASELVSRLGTGGARIEQRTGGNPDDFQGADAVLVIPRDFKERLAQGGQAKVTLLRNERRQSSAVGAGMLGEQIREYADEVARARLTGRGLAPDLAEPIMIEERNIATVSMAAVMTVNMMLYFFILAPFFTSMTAAIDATAGERERQSLKPLLAQPIDPAGLIAGKWGVSSLFGIVGTAVTIFFGAFLLGFAPLEKLGVDLPLTFANQALMTLLLAPLALAVAGVQSLVALLAKTFKEAQTYIQLLSLAPVGVLFMTSFSGEETGEVMRMLPLTGHADLLGELMTEGPIDWTQALVITLASLAVGAVSLVISQKHVQNEKMLGEA